jgi:serine/threonine-protein kinase
MEEQRTTEIRRGPTPPPPWYREHWWIWLVALLLIVGGIIAFFALRGDDTGNEGSGRVTVPNVVGLQERMARARLEERGFAVDTERAAHEGREGTVVEQDPSAGSRLSRGARVRIVLSTGPAQTVTQTQTQTQTQAQTTSTGPETLEVPDVVGTEYPDAVKQLLEAGVFPDGTAVMSPQEGGLVVGQRPPPGSDVTVGSAVGIAVSQGAGERDAREVPDLTGQSLPDALRVCADAHLICQILSGTARARQVVEQRPAAGSSAPEWSEIALSTG